MKTIHHAAELDRTPVPESGLDNTLETRLINMLKDGMCDLYDAAAVLQAAGRRPLSTMSTTECPEELKVVWKA